MHRGRLSQRHNQGTLGDLVTSGVSLLVFYSDKMNPSTFNIDSPYFEISFNTILNKMSLVNMFTVLIMPEEKFCFVDDEVTIPNVTDVFPLLLRAV